jgi:predicted dehydrogenase
MSDASIRIALVGGGVGSFIGDIHRMAAQLDGRFALVAGVFGRDPAKSRVRGREWGVAIDRIYADHSELIIGETQRQDGVACIVIATPNESHFAIASDALRAGLHVICDKPMTATLEQAELLVPIVAASRGIYALTFTYTGYAMVREARARIAAGDIGEVRKIVVDYPQGWLSNGAGDAQIWRLDPARAGLGGCAGDIGVHAFQLAEYVSGQRVTELNAMLSSMVAGRRLDDDCNVLMRLTNGGVAVLTASQIATGERNGLSIRVHGASGTLAWRHEDPAVLRIDRGNGRSELLHAGAPDSCPAAKRATRLPMGHPEGFIEAMATIYRDVADALLGTAPSLIDGEVPGVTDGLRSMRFIDRAIVSNRHGRWTSMEERP